MNTLECPGSYIGVRSQKGLVTRDGTYLSQVEDVMNRRAVRTTELYVKTR